MGNLSDLSIVNRQFLSSNNTTRKINAQCVLAMHCVRKLATNLLKLATDLLQLAKLAMNR